MIQTKEEARESLLKGLNILADLVKTTLGPHGSTVILHTFEGKAYTTKDGVSVARQVFDNDMMVDAGIQLVREATSKTAEVAGDGTTTSTILTQALITRCMQAIKEEESPLILKQQMDLALKDIIELLKSPDFSTKVGFDKKSLKDIATISANNDSQLGELIADAFIEAGDTERLRWTIIKHGASEIAGEENFVQLIDKQGNQNGDGTYCVDPAKHKSARLNRKFYLPLDTRPENYNQPKVPLNHIIFRYADVL
jgi:chaperonin GroEL (HSP60 family)